MKSTPQAGAACTEGTVVGLEIFPTSGTAPASTPAGAVFQRLGARRTARTVAVGIYQQLWDSDDKFDLTYEDVKDMIGTDGELIAGESSEERHYYLWYGEGSNVILTVVFKGNDVDGYTLNAYAIAGDY